MAYDETEDTYDIHVGYRTIVTLVTNSPDAVDSWISDIEHIHRRRLDRLVVGLDVEWRPPFAGGARNPVATLQLCVGHRCLVFQILHAPYTPDSLGRFLSDDDYTFVGVGIQSDVDKLRHDHDLHVARWVDLAPLAAHERDEPGMRNFGLCGLGRAILGLDVDKPRSVRIGPWDDRVLEFPQVRYAALDAFMSFELGKVLEAWQ